MIFNKEDKYTYRRKDNISSKWSWENRASTCRSKKLDPYLSLCPKVRFKWINTSKPSG